MAKIIRSANHKLSHSGSSPCRRTACESIEILHQWTIKKNKIDTLCTFCFIAFLKPLVPLHFAFSSCSCRCCEETPPPTIPHETLHLLPLCSRSPSLCAFSSTSPFVCVLVCCALFYQSMRLLHRDQSASPHAGGEDLGPCCTDNDVDDKKKGDEGKRILASASWTNAPLEHVTNKRSFSSFCYRAAFTGLCFNMKDSAVSHIQLIRN